MERKQFVKSMLGLSTLTALGGLSFGSITREKDTLYSDNIPEEKTTSDFITFGAVHLEITNLQRSINFWIEIAGLTLRNRTTDMAEMGTGTQTLVVLHQTATAPFREGFSGLYHFAIHAPSREEFANMLYRVMALRYPHSPVDHLMSQSVYLNDPDGITVEFALETPERFKQVTTENGGLQMIDSEGKYRGATERLDVNDILKSVTDKNLKRVVADETCIGHIHFYATDLDPTNAFYREIGLNQFNYLPAFMYADLGAGGPYQHRVALNTWHGKNKPVAPSGNAGLLHYQIVFQTEERLQYALAKLTNSEKKEDGYHVTDPSGNKLVLTLI